MSSTNVLSQPGKGVNLTGFEIIKGTSWITRFGYHPVECTLFLEYNNSKASVITNFPAERFAAMKQADSVGKYYHTHIRTKYIETPVAVALAPVPAPAPPWLPVPEDGVDPNTGAVLSEGQVVYDPLDPPTDASGRTPHQIAAALPDGGSLQEEGEPEIVPPNENALMLRARSVSLAEQARPLLTIADDGVYNKAADVFEAVLAMEKEIIGEYAEMKQAAYLAHRAVCNSETRMLAPVLEAKQALSLAIGEYDAARKQRDAEALREARLISEQAGRAVALAAAVEAEVLGASPEEVEHIINNPTPAPMAMVAPVHTSSRRFAGRENWVPYGDPTLKPRESLLQLVKAAAENPDAYLDCLAEKWPELRNRAKNQNVSFNVPGYIARNINKATGKALNGGK